MCTVQWQEKVLYKLAPSSVEQICPGSSMTDDDTRMVKGQASECQKKDLIESNHCTVWQKIQIRKNNRSTANMQRSDIPQVWNWKTAFIIIGVKTVQVKMGGL